MKYLYSLTLLFFCNYAISQSLAINTDGSTANASALLDIKSTTKGLLIPRVTKAQKNAIVTPATGLLIFQTSPDSIGFHYYNGTQWQWMDAFVSTGWKTTGNTGTDTAVNFIGNIDNIPLRFKQGNVRMGQLNINTGTYFFGKGAGVRANTTAFGSVGIGDSTLTNLSSGDNNIAIGTDALKIVSTGSNNTAIGNQADAGFATITNATAIGAFAQVDASNTMVLGSVNGVNGATSNVKVAIGTTTASASLHLRKASSGSLLIIPIDRTLLIEDSTSSFLQLLNPDNAQTGIFSGNTETLRRSGLIFNADSSISLRVGGATRDRFFLDKSGSVGIGNTAPKATLHIANQFLLPNAKYFTNASAIFDYSLFGNTALQLMCKASSSFSIFSGTDSVFARSAIEFNFDSSIRFYSGGGISSGSEMIISKSGKVGIKTLSPQAYLDVDNTFKLGTSGTVNAALILKTVNIIVGAIPGNGELDVTVAVANVATDAAISITPSDDLPAGIVIAWSRVSSAGNIKVRFRNLTGSAINPANIDYQILAVQ